MLIFYTAIFCEHTDVWQTDGGDVKTAGNNVSLLLINEASAWCFRKILYSVKNLFTGSLCSLKDRVLSQGTILEMLIFLHGYIL